MGLLNMPRPSISTVQRSPAFMNSIGRLAQPMPAGVPETMTSPGSRVTASLRVAISSATSKIRSAVLACCSTLPFRRVVRPRPRAPGGSSSAETKEGPKAPVASKFLPMVHCGDLNW
ncbi:hypothetical protein D3C85_1385040 [compost metagenome]